MPPEQGVASKVVIEGDRQALGAELRELWRYRDIGLVLGLRDIKVRYRQTLFGVGWAVLQPLMALVVFSVVFGRFARLSSDGQPYPVFAYAGILPWTLVSTIVSGAALSLVANERLITKVYFPRLLIPLSVVGYATADFAFALLLAVPLLAVYKAPVPPLALALPLVIVLLIVTGVGCGLFLAALNVKYRDIRHVVPFALQIWLFASPVVYSVSMVPQPLRRIAAINPMVGLITTFRTCLLGTPVDTEVAAISALLSVVIFAAGLHYFRRVEAQFADVV